MRMPQRYVCNKCYSDFLNGKFTMKKKAFKKVLKDAHYVKRKAPVFEMAAYHIKSGKSWVKTGE